MDLCVMIEGQEDVGWEQLDRAGRLAALRGSGRSARDDLDQLALIGGELAGAVR